MHWPLIISCFMYPLAHIEEIKNIPIGIQCRVTQPGLVLFILYAEWNSNSFGSFKNETTVHNDWISCEVTLTKMFLSNGPNSQLQ